MPRGAGQLGPYDHIVAALGLYPNLQPDAFYKKFGRDITDEIFKIRDDAPYFLEKYVYIDTKDPSKGIIPFKFKRAQRFFWDNYFAPYLDKKPIRNISLKARQIGWTTISQLVFEHKTQCFAGTNALVAADSSNKSQEILQKAKLAYAMMPPELRPTSKKSNRSELDFNNPDEKSTDIGIRSKFIVATADSDHIGASYTLQLVQLSEFGRYEAVNRNIKSAMATLKQSIPDLPGTMLIIESTAFGANYFQEVWEREGDEYDRIFISWLADDDYRSENLLTVEQLNEYPLSEYGDEEEERVKVIDQLAFWYPEYDGDTLQKESLHRLAWRRKKIKNDLEGDLDLWNREYPSTAEQAFATSGANVFDLNKLAHYKKQAYTLSCSTYSYDFESASFVEVPRGELRVYKAPKKDYTYFLGVDISSGIREGDPSVIQVVDCQYNQVARYRDWLEPDELAEVAYKLALMYNEAKINPEANSMGIAFISSLIKQKRYTNVYRREQKDAVRRSPSNRYGFFTSVKTKPELIAGFREKFRKNEFVPVDLDTINEMTTFVEDNGRMAASGSNNDDCVIAMGLALYIVQYRDMLQIEKEAERKKGTVRIMLPDTAVTRNLMSPRAVHVPQIPDDFVRV